MSNDFVKEGSLMAEVEELRVQPQDILAEQSVLGAIFIDESKLVFVRDI